MYYMSYYTTISQRAHITQQIVGEVGKSQSFAVGDPHGRTTFPTVTTSLRPAQHCPGAGPGSGALKSANITCANIHRQTLKQTCTTNCVYGTTCVTTTNCRRVFSPEPCKRLPKMAEVFDLESLVHVEQTYISLISLQICKRNKIDYDHQFL